MKVHQWMAVRFAVDANFVAPSLWSLQSSKLDTKEWLFGVTNWEEQV